MDCEATQVLSRCYELDTRNREKKDVNERVCSRRGFCNIVDWEVDAALYVREHKSSRISLLCLAADSQGLVVARVYAICYPKLPESVRDRTAVSIPTNRG